MSFPHKPVLSTHYVSNTILKTREEDDNPKGPCVTKSAIYSLFHWHLLGPQENGISKKPSWLSVAKGMTFGQQNVGRVT